MINIIHVNVHYDDRRNITALEVKLKFLKNNENEEELPRECLNSTILAAFFKTTFLADEGQSLTVKANPKRSNIVNLHIALKENNMKLQDITNFIEAFQTAIDTTSLF
jgi:hypothetical protein